MRAEEKKALLKLARESIIAAACSQPPPAQQKFTAVMEQQAGCFVTIKKDGKLRGCIGSFISERPLWETVREMAASAATRDPRFYPMKPADIEDFSVEISVLSPLRQIESIEDIRVGRDGIYIIKGSYHGVLLPQVATEYGWDRETFIRQTCRKAGLPDDAWQKGCEIYIFSADVFGEN